MRAHWVSFAAFLLAAGIGLGAYAAHSVLRIDAEELAVVYFQKAQFYHFVHALSLLFLALLPGGDWLQEWIYRSIAGLFALGLFLFSGSLYLMAFGFSSELRYLTPFGGMAFIVGWLLLSAGAYRAGSGKK